MKTTWVKFWYGKKWHWKNRWHHTPGELKWYSIRKTACGLPINAKEVKEGIPKGRLCKRCVKLLKSKMTYQIDEAAEVLAKLGGVNEE